MSEPQVQTIAEPRRVAHERRTPHVFRHVMACLDCSSNARAVLEKAAAIARMTDADLTALRVLPVSDTQPLADPVDWDLKRRAEIGKLRNLAKEVGAPEEMDTSISNGPEADCICREARERGVDLAVLGAGSINALSGWGLGGTVRQVAERFSGSVLIVPGEPPRDRTQARRILVLLDGSAEAEAALRIAVALAEFRSAELVLLHAVPEIGLATAGPPEPEDEKLCARLRQRADRAAQKHLDRVRRLIPAHSIRSRVRLLSGEEPRRALVRAVLEEQAELVVLSARGQGGDPDLPIGSTANYIISHAVSPVLMVRSLEGGHRNKPLAAPRRRAVARGIW